MRVRCTNRARETAVLAAESIDLRAYEEGLVTIDGCVEGIELEAILRRVIVESRGGVEPFGEECARTQST